MKQLRLSFTLLIFLLPSIEAWSQREAKSNSLPPPRPNLLTVHWPDLSTLESDVQQHLVTSQASLTASVKNPSATDATLTEAYGVMGQTFHAYSLNSPAWECYVNASRLAPGDFRWAYLIAKLDHQAGRVDEAIKSYRLVQNLKPEYVAAAVNLGNIYLETNRLVEARANFAAALKIEKDNAAAHYGLGQVALGERNYEEAVRYFERALAIVPAANRIHYSLAMGYRGLGELEKAKASLGMLGTVGVRSADPLIDELPEFIKGERVHLIRGRLAVEAYRYAEAASEFRKAIAVKPGSVTGRTNLGAVLSVMGDVQGAKQQFEEVLRIAPENPTAHYNLGLLFANENRHQEAIYHLRSVLKANPKDSGARFLLAQVYLKSEQREEALEEFSRVVEADPSNEEALLQQVRLLLRKQEYDRAKDSLEKAYSRHPQNVQTAAMLAYLLATSPRHELRDGTRALKLAQLVYEASGALNHGVMIALALAELGRCEEAAQWQRKLIVVAEREGNVEVLANLKRDLTTYERSQTCRPRDHDSKSLYP
jgi:tetratricopeptide (TPR) repeat protein